MCLSFNQLVLLLIDYNCIRQLAIFVVPMTWSCKLPGYQVQNVHYDNDEIRTCINLEPDVHYYCFNYSSLSLCIYTHTLNQFCSYVCVFKPRVHQLTSCPLWYTFLPFTHSQSVLPTTSAQRWIATSGLGHHSSLLKVLWLSKLAYTYPHKKQVFRYTRVNTVTKFVWLVSNHECLVANGLSCDCILIEVHSDLWLYPSHTCSSN